ncbi:MAG: pirin family protein [Croceibacterium sp.]
MIELRPYASLGGADLGWLDTRHHFSFADYFDPKRTQWGAIRVWNDDVIAPKSGFPPHSHRDMEIITYVRSGAITHKDSLGNTGRTGAGDVQVMSAGSGIEHAEYNLEDEPTTLFQIWIMPDGRGGEPGWGARPFPKDNRAGQFVPLAYGQPGDAALPIRADARVLGATIKAGDTIGYDTAPARHLYLVPATGKVRVGEMEMNARDGAAISGLARIEVTALEDSELVLVDAR